MKTMGFCVAVFVCSFTASAHQAKMDDVAHLSSEHRFAEALTVLRKQVERRPQDGRRWLQIASISLVVGNVDDATEACRHAAGYVDPIASLACRGRIALVTGNVEQTYQRLKGFLHLQHYRERKDDLTLWATGIAAELADALGYTGEADQLFRRALTADGSDALPTRPQLKVAYADLLIRTDRFDEVIRRFSDHSENLALQLRWLRAHDISNRENEFSQTIAVLNHDFVDQMSTGDYTHAREMAYFYLHILPDATLAKFAARQNAMRQREPEDLLLLRLAEAHAH